MKIPALMAMWLAGAAAQAQQAPAQEATAPEVKIEVMTCAQLKAEGQRQLAIMQHMSFKDLDAELSDDVDMIRLGERQGKRSIALGALQAAAGLTGNAVAVGQAGRAADAMTSIDKMDRDAILTRGHLRNKANERIENQAGAHFEAITEQYRRRGCAG